MGWPAFDRNGVQIHNGQISRSVMSFHLFLIVLIPSTGMSFLHFQARCMKKKPTASDFPKKFKTLERFEFPAVLPSDLQQSERDSFPPNRIISNPLTFRWQKRHPFLFFRKKNWTWALMTSKIRENVGSGSDIQRLCKKLLQLWGHVSLKMRLDLQSRTPKPPIKTCHFGNARLVMNLFFSFETSLSKKGTTAQFPSHPTLCKSTTFWAQTQTLGFLRTSSLARKNVLILIKSHQGRFITSLFSTPVVYSRSSCWWIPNLYL